MTPPPEIPHCKLCGSVELKPVTTPHPRYGTDYRVLFCRDCRIGITWPPPRPELLEGLYAPGTYRGDQGKRFVAPVELLFELHKRFLAARLTAQARQGRMLDIGCGSGFQASLFVRSGWEVTGVELNDDTASHARQTHGIRVFTSTAAISEHFDLILVNHVLEHCPDPEAMLDECRRLLSPNGRLVVAVPNLSSLQAKIGGKSWFHLDLPLHLLHFTEQGLADLLVKRGFAITKRSTADGVQNFYGWLQTLLNLAGVRHNLLYDLLRGQVSGKPFPVAALALSLIHCSWAFPGTLLGLVAEKLFRTGGVIRYTVAADPAVSSLTGRAARSVRL